MDTGKLRYDPANCTAIFAEAKISHQVLLGQLLHETGDLRP